ncbi:MAG: DUF5688 family protein [Lachnospiraceae bacterium]|nr:DUF5688 family protein [Lachnospiraceae bacterium]
MEAWGVDTQELLQRAQANTIKLFPWECARMGDILARMDGQDGDALGLDEFSQEVPMRVLSNSRRLYGASCMLYPGVLSGIAAEEGSNLYVIPCSLHELILLPDDGEVPIDTLKAMVYEVNRTCVVPEEVLSDSLYYYDREKDEVVVL